MKLNRRFWEWDVFHFGKAGVVMALYSLFLSWLLFTKIDFDGITGWVVGTSLTFPVKYFVMKFFWKDRKK